MQTQDPIVTRRGYQRTLELELNVVCELPCGVFTWIGNYTLFLFILLLSIPPKAL